MLTFGSQSAAANDFRGWPTPAVSPAPSAALRHRAAVPNLNLGSAAAAECVTFALRASAADYAAPDIRVSASGRGPFRPVPYRFDRWRLISSPRHRLAARGGPLSSPLPAAAIAIPFPYSAPSDQS